MKSKYLGLLGMLVATVGALAVAAQLLWESGPTVRPRGQGVPAEPYSTARLVVDKPALSRMDLVEPTLAGLVKPERIVTAEAMTEVSGVDYVMFGRLPPAVPVAHAEPEPDPPAPPRVRAEPYRIAMTYISGSYRYAVVNHRLYPQGALLPGGEKLTEVAANSVRIESASGARWVSIQHVEKSGEVRLE